MGLELNYIFKVYGIFENDPLKVQTSLKINTVPSLDNNYNELSMYPSLMPFLVNSELNRESVQIDD